MNEEFLRDLTEVSRKHGLVLETDGCREGIFIAPATGPEPRSPFGGYTGTDGHYVTSDDGRWVWWDKP